MKLVEKVLNKKYHSTYKDNEPELWGEIIFLYDDKNWEKVFEYHWKDRSDV